MGGVGGYGMEEEVNDRGRKLSGRVNRGGGVIRGVEFLLDIRG